MKYINAILIVLLITSCNSMTTLEDVQEQKAEAHSELNEAQAEMVELAEVKEEYSIDSKIAMIKDLEKRRKQINSDIKNLGKVESEGLTQASESMISELKEEDDEIKNRLQRLEKVEKENWQSATDSITNLIGQLENKINDITANIEE